ncbi:hypothetical protein M0812_05248 [Anaeramoeba flamelloides]|uniref:BTB domain-containing protein n=1 Tax=Anaeramoeba flamelloides TaxID=1746091 RepID=A0AAV8A6D6_9EUKA|nr:hypothetical protein M0812_05248 [Anaeramoeba flamelloides]
MMKILTYQLTSILTNDGKLYRTGNARKNGFGRDLSDFKQYPQFKNNNTIIKDIDCGYELFAILTQYNEVWVQGSFNGINSDGLIVIRKIKTGNNLTTELSAYKQIKFCDLNLIFFFKSNSYLSQDLEKTNEILNHFGIQNAQKTKLLKNDLKQLLFDEQTSDFKLVVKNIENEDEELYIHKFILAARSGLFLNMFQNIEENFQKVKDYSGKSLETIELLISFLYTDELPITADTDQEFIKKEFEDIVEYYQLNRKNSNHGYF